MVKRGFVPRGGRPPRPPRRGWADRLVGWTDHHHRWVARVAANLDDTQRGAVVRTARKLAKKSVRVARAAGPVRTARPVGTRMGKGKGKPAGHRGWTPRGVTLFEVTAPAGVARRCGVLTKRSAARIVQTGRSY